MSDQHFSDRHQRLYAVLRVLSLASALSLAGTLSGRADEPKRTGAASRAIVGKCVTSTGGLLRREATGSPWQLCKHGEPVRNGEHLVALAAVAMDSNNGAVHLSLLPDLAGLSSLPVSESAVVVHENPGTDLEFTLERGRVAVTNQQKNKEPARVCLHFRKETWELTLATPGTNVTLVLYGRWPRGMPFTKEAKAGDEPTADLVVFVSSGNVQLKTRTDQYALHGAPGPASFHWDSVAGADAGPQHQDKVPGWARADLAAPPLAQGLTAAVERLSQRLENEPVKGALSETLHSPNANDRRVAVNALGSLDDLPDLIAALSEPKHEGTRNVAIITLRHWIGRAPGQDQRLYDFLVQSKNYSPNQAAIVLQLLHSFGDNDRGQPVTYETLIDYLLHDKLAIRQLAKWHLYRLVGAGREIAYDAAGSSEGRHRAYDQWKRLVPNGKLPPAEKSK
jgi:hypothetical protein